MNAYCVLSSVGGITGDERKAGGTTNVFMKLRVMLAFGLSSSS